MEETTTTLASFLGDVTTVLTSAVDWVSACAGMVMANPLLLVPTIMGIGLVGIGIIKRFI